MRWAFLLLFLLLTPFVVADKTDWITSMSENTRYCDDDCRMTFNYCNPSDSDISSEASNFNFAVKDMNTGKEEYPVWTVTQKEVKEDVYGMVQNSYVCNYEHSTDKDVFECVNNTPNLNGTKDVIFSHAFTSFDKNTYFWEEYKKDWHIVHLPPPIHFKGRECQS